MDRPSTFVRQPRFKAVPIINPQSGERQPIPLLQRPSAASSSPSHLTSSASGATADISTSIDRPAYPTSGSSEDGKAFDVYARPFIPEAFTIINELAGPIIDTPPTRQLNFAAYGRDYIGLNILPAIPQPIEAPIYAPLSLTDDIIHTAYEQYFRYHLEEEIKAQQRENESYSLYGYEISTLFRRDDPTVIVSFRVPGLSENSPYIEEDDVIQLRQLRYDHTGRLLGMDQWMAPNSQPRGSVRDLPAVSGWLRDNAAPGWTGLIYNARVSRVVRKEERLVVKVFGLRAFDVNNHLLSGNLQPKFNIQFPVPEERYRPMEQALSIIQRSLTHSIPSITTSRSNSSYVGRQTEARHRWLQSMLFPTEVNCEVQTELNPGVFNRPFFDEQLNWEQQKAIESICLQNYGILPFLISGPPGTGKTKILVETALQLIYNVDEVSHVLFTAPSDPAADTIVQRLSAHFKPAELLRLNKPSRSFAEVSGAVLPFCYIAERNSEEVFCLPPFEQLLSYKIVVTTCRDASLLIYSRMTNSDLYTAESRLLNAIHPHEPQPLQAKLHWTALLIDEAAQAIEPEALIALAVVAPPLEPVNFAVTPLFVMAGDEHQLGPRTSLHSSPLLTSLFARLFTRPIYANHPLARSNIRKTPFNRAMLPILRPAFANMIRNYRSHPAILAVPSALFYADTLEPEATGIDRLASWHAWQGLGWPVLFYNNDSDDELERDGGGWYNIGEAHIACKYATDLVHTGLVTQKEVCIMSPFKAQVRLLRNIIRSQQYGSLWDVDIGPTETFQGLERGVVILCTTRSKQRFLNRDQELHWGIIGMPTKMNVAMTRAMFGLIVIGKRDILLHDPNWVTFLDFCDRNGLMTGKADSGVQRRDRDHVELTRLEKVLLAQERDADRSGDSQVLNGASHEDAMWTSGMRAALDMDDTYGY